MAERTPSRPTLEPSVRRKACGAVARIAGHQLLHRVDARSARVAATSRWTNTRCTAMQDWPAWYIAQVAMRPAAPTIST